MIRSGTANARSHFRWHGRFLRGVLLALGLTLMAGCAKPELSDQRVRAASEQELTAFRAELGAQFTTAQLATFDTALQELRLAGIERGIASAAARDAEMRTTVDGKTVREVEIAGFEARRVRLNGEITQLSATLERDLQTRAAKGAETSLTVANRIQNVQDILARLQRDLAATEQQLAAWKSEATAGRR